MFLFQDLIGTESSEFGSAVGPDLRGPVQRPSSHYLGRRPLGRSAPFNPTEFGFRTIAGVYFAILLPSGASE
jgi:hypothetical protein